MRNREAEACRVCGGTSRYVYSLPVLGEEVDYFDCTACGYFQTQEPHWLEKAYGSAINSVDTGILLRNRLNVWRVATTLMVLGKLKGTVVDHAGGYGILVRLLRDAGVDAYWRDKYCENLVARGFEANAAERNFDLLTAFEVFEHLVDPVGDLRAMLRNSRTVFMSTDLIVSAEPPPRDWWYLGPEHGQHIGFFRLNTLEWIASELGCHMKSDGRTLHMFSLDPIPSYWPTFMRLRFLGRIAARMTLHSRTMTDFADLRARQAGADA